MLSVATVVTVVDVFKASGTMKSSDTSISSLDAFRQPSFLEG